METALGILAAAAGGLAMGSLVWPIKLMRKFQFEHWWFLAMLTGLIVVPWTITLAAFPHAIEAYRDVPASVLIKANLFAACWGVANVLFALSVVRIGVALTTAVLTGLGASVTVTMPMVFKGSGLFRDAPGITSRAGHMVLVAVGVMLVGVILASQAGFGRDQQVRKHQSKSGSFLIGLIMAVIAGITSAGILLAFVYSQAPIVARMSILHVGQNVKVTVADREDVSGIYAVLPDGKIALPKMSPIAVGGMTAKAAADKIGAALGLSQRQQEREQVEVEAQGDVLVQFSVWAVVLLGGALVNLIFPAFLMTKNRSWGVLASSWKEVALSLIIGVQFCLAIALVGKGMVLLGILGASVGAGIQQAMQMIGGQGLGFVSGEWRDVHGRPRQQIYAAIVLLVVATTIMAFSNTPPR
ncbi:MAG: polysaccharide biosynthesis/export family protein [Planctomycetaceae bacterium]|nr:polysaccharide biosynthesis/export family protein [Planctomycetaceae bacterium]